ncbi:RF-1 domain-containing protein [Corynascus similis CBS 632.67]
MLRPFASLRALFRSAGTIRNEYGLPSANQGLRHSFSTSVTLQKKQLPPRPKHPPESEIEESFLKGSGPGGQKINKTNSAVQIKHLPTGIVVKSQATRSRTQNRKIARDLLALKLDELANGPQSRAAVVSEVKKKRAASRAKKSRRKYRKLAQSQDNEGSIAEEAEVGEDVEGGEWEEVYADRVEEVKAETEGPQFLDRTKVQSTESTNTKNKGQYSRD